MKAFYHETLGFPVYAALGDWIELQVDSVLLTLRKRGRWYDGPRLAPESAAVQLAFRVAPDEVDQWHADLVGKGVEMLEEPIDREFGHRTLHFKDPEGTILEIYADISRAT